MCLEPIKGRIMTYFKPETGEIKQCVRPNTSAYFPRNMIKMENIDIACGKCVECEMAKSREWAYRLVNEASLYDENCFITLTYADAPEYLQKRDYQLFLKRLRKKYNNKKIRYFCCGEYGGKKGRPHFHMILFNYQPHDLEYFFTDKQGFPIFKSNEIAEIWGKGYITVGVNMTVKSMMYQVKYLQKQRTGYDDLKVKPFVSMSLKPGIGAEWFFNNQKCLDSDKIYLEGNYNKVPRYYLKLNERQGKIFDKTNRIKKAQLGQRTKEQLEAKKAFLYKLLDIK